VHEATMEAPKPDAKFLAAFYIFVTFCYFCYMRTVSHYVQEIVEKTPLLSELLSEGLGNINAIARNLKKEVERRTLTKVSVQSIAMALRRLPENKKHP